jgi:general secretion pathway protein M
MDHRLDKFLARYPAVAAGCYFAIVAVLAVVAWIAIADLLDRQQAVAQADELLAQLERGRQTAASSLNPSGDAPQGSPFLEGHTVTVAGAALLARVAGAVTRAGGSVLSSQVDVKEAQSKAGLLSMVASCEIAQPDLQKLLYDLEAGMPYLFIDQLSVQSPDSVTRGEGGRLRVVLGVSGQWQGAK